MRAAYELVRGKRKVGLTDKDVDYFLKTVRQELRYLSGRSAKARAGDANATKRDKLRVLQGKLEEIKR
jgi:hypothetical protein